MPSEAGARRRGSRAAGRVGLSLAAVTMVTGLVHVATASAAPDPGFSGDGVIDVTGARQVAAHAWGDGTVTAVGISSGSNSSVSVTRLSSGGAVIGSTTIATPNGVQLWEGKGLAAAGSDLIAQFSSSAGAALLRLNPAGGAVTSFSGDGWVTTGLGSCNGGDGDISDVAVGPDGSISTVAWNFLGNTPADCDGTGVRRYDASGNQLNWGNDQFEGSQTDNRLESMAITVDGGGNVYTTGVIFNNGGQTEHVGVLKLTPAGAPAGGFGANGLASIDVGTVNEWYGYVPGFSRTFAARTGADLVIDSQGRIVIVGAGPRAAGGGGGIDAWVARLLPTGGPDPSFSGDGVMSFDVNGGSADYGLRVAVDASDRPIVAGVTHATALTGGSDQRREFTARVTTSGVLDGAPVVTGAGAGHSVHPTSLSVGGSRAVIGGARLDASWGYVSAHVFNGSTGTTTTTTAPTTTTSTTATTTTSTTSTTAATTTTTTTRPATTTTTTTPPTSTTTSTSTTSTVPPTTTPPTTTPPTTGGGSGGPPAGQLFTSMTPWRAHDSRSSAAVHAGVRRPVKVAGVTGGAPASAVAVAVNLTVVDPTHGGYVTIFPGGAAVPHASTVNLAAGQTMANSVVVGVGPGGTVDVIVGAGAAHVIVDVMGYFTTGHGFEPIHPTRALDSRIDVPLGPGQTRTVTVASAALGGTAGGKAVALNLTAVDPTAGGHLRVWPGNGPEPHASVLNFGPGQTVANGFVSGVDGSGVITVRNHSGGTVHLVIDVNGVFRATSAFHPVTPVRADDTRTGAPVGAGANRQVRVTGIGQVPASGVRGVVVNVTVTEPTSAGYVSAYPAGTPTPLASLLNFNAGVTVANAVVVGVDASGHIELHNSVGATHLVTDVLGWF